MVQGKQVNFHARPPERLAFLSFGGILFSMLTKRVKSNVIKEHQKHEKDTGSAKVQIAVLSRQIDELATHLKKNPKDNHSRRGLLKMVGHRRRLLNYLKKHEPADYEKLLKKLDLKR